MKKFLILALLLAMWILLFFVPKATAEAPQTSFPIPQEIVGNPVKEFAYNQVGFKWGAEHWESFNNIIERESKWDPEAKNPTSSAYGLGQFLNSTWADTGYIKSKDPYIQIAATIDYISARYDNPQKAWVSWQKNNWY